MRKDTSKLTPKQARFVEEYLIDLNATQAYIRAGYAAKGAAVSACKLLTILKIQTYIQKKRADMSEKLEISAERVLQEHAKIAFYNIIDLFNDDGTMKPINEIKRSLGAAMHGIEVVDISSDENVNTLIKKIRFQSKDKALDALSKHLGLFDADNTQKGNADLMTLSQAATALVDGIRGTTGLPEPRDKK
ncbi:MAG: terminase small subunit [Deltaproteobacteria bacterium]|nr:MAG: terminase small subunit [Deltaproteobacteria bacterium]